MTSNTDPIVTEVPAEVLRRERTLRIFRGVATFCYMGFGLTGMLFLVVLLLGSLGAHNILGSEAIEVLCEFTSWPLLFQIFMPVGAVIAVVDSIFRYKRVYRYL